MSVYTHSKNTDRKDLSENIHSTLTEMGLKFYGNRRISGRHEHYTGPQYVREVVGDQDVSTGIAIRVVVDMSKKTKVIRPLVTTIDVHLTCQRGHKGHPAKGANVFEAHQGVRTVSIQSTSITLTGSKTIGGIVMDVADAVRDAWAESFKVPRCKMCGAPNVTSKAGNPYCSDICWEHPEVRAPGRWRNNIRPAPYGTKLGDWEPDKPASAWREEYKVVAQEMIVEFGTSAAQLRELVVAEVNALPGITPTPDEFVAAALVIQDRMRLVRYEKAAAAAALKPPTDSDIQDILGLLIDE